MLNPKNGGEKNMEVDGSDDESQKWRWIFSDEFPLGKKIGDF